MKKRMRMIMAMAVVLLSLLTSGTVLAASSGKCGINITWTLDDNGNLVLTGSGPMGDYLYGRGPWKDCESLIKTVSIGDGITSIGDYTFQECSGLTSVVIPNSVTSIGVYAFLKCSGMASLVIGNSVTSIGRYAFCGCSSLTSVVMGNSVGGVGKLAFYGCSNLTEVFITDLAAWCMIEFNGYVSNPLYFAHHLFLNGIEVKDLVIPNSVTSIGNFAFHGCSELTSVEIPNSVKNIGESAFNGCSGLTRITVGGLNPTYDSRDNCNAIIETSTGKIILACKNTNIPNGVIGIDRDDFSGISGLESVTIPASVVSIEGGAFSCCPDLMSIYVDGNNPTYDSRDNCNAIIEKSSNTLISSCVGTKIPSSVTSIGDNAFYGCSGLTSVAIPNSVTSIGDNAFSDCI